MLVSGRGLQGSASGDLVFVRGHSQRTEPGSLSPGPGPGSIAVGDAAVYATFADARVPAYAEPGKGVATAPEYAVPAGAQAGAGGVVYATPPAGTGASTGSSAVDKEGPRDVYASAQSYADRAVHASLSRAAAEEALRAHGLVPGVFLLRRKGDAVVMTLVAKGPPGVAFAHHILEEAGPGGGMLINKKPLSKSCGTLSAAVAHLQQPAGLADIRTLATELVRPSAC